MGKSKRQRKDGNVQSLRNKGVQQQELAMDLLSDELKEQLLSGSSGQEQLLVLPGRKKTPAAGENPTPVEVAPELSKSQLRKLKQIQQKKERRENISQVLDQLHSSSMSDVHLALLRPLHQRGARETKKQRLRRALQLERAGVAPSAEQTQELYRPRTTAASDTLTGDASSSDDDQPPPTVQPQYVTLAQGAAAVSQAGQQVGASDESSEGAEEGVQDDGDAPTDAQAQQHAAAVRSEVLKARLAAGITDHDVDPEERAELASALQRGALAAAEAQALSAAGGRAAGQHRVVHVKRPPDIEAARRGLPILGMEQEIVEAVAAHDVVVLCGETGCGKTTQVPQFLLEAGYGCSAFPERGGCVGVTQPRRVAATSTAGRVAHELGGELGHTVGYQVRYDRQVGAATRIKFMTDGILLRELQDDFLLRRYSALLVDEAHERSLNTDLLLGMLSRVVALRRQLCTKQRAAPGYRPDAPESVHPLKVIIMSATLRTSDFVANTKLFPSPPPIIEVPARQYPVTVHFARRTEMTDYLGVAFRKVVRVHSELPPGGVLVFLTGQREVEHMCSKLRARFSKPGQPHLAQALEPAQPSQQAGQPSTNGVQSALAGGSVNEGRAEGAAEEDTGGDQFGGGDLAETAGSWQGDAQGAGKQEEADDYNEMNDSEDEDEEEVEVMGGDCMTPEEIAAAEKRFEEQLGGKAVAGPRPPEAAAAGPGPVHVLPLYAMLPAAAQARVFEAPPPGHRLIVVATNVAETSLTIPGIRYVVDAGRSKQRLLEADGGGMARFEVRWVSQAAAAQRAGRAGRTGPGHTYRLFSSAHFKDCLPLHTPPEIANTSLEGVLLVLKSMGVDKVHNFPFPSPPDPEALRAAERCLVALCALDGRSGALTDVGRAMAAFPIGPRHARMLLEVVAWQLKLVGAASESAAAAGARPPPAHVARQALPYAVALAAALAVESPFMHVDTNPLQQQEGNNERGGEEDSDREADGEKSREDKAAERAARAGQAKARQAQAALRCPQSDALSALRALCAYEASTDSASFCAEHHLHLRILQEAADLHRQLLKVLAAPPTGALGSSGQQPLACQLAELVGRQGSEGMLQAVAVPRGTQFASTAVQDCLRRAMAVGWADSVGRRVRTAEQLVRQQQQQHDGTGGKRHAVRYVSCAIANAHAGGVGAVGAAARLAAATAVGTSNKEDVSGDVFLHPRSTLHAAAPEYVTYTQIVRTAKRPYMGGVTAIQAEWLVQSGTPLATWSQPLLEPPPFYRPPPVDAVLAWHDVTYGRHMWALPRCLKPHPEFKVVAAVLATALLEGQLAAGLTEFRGAWVNAPAVASRPEMRGVARVGELVGALERQHVTNRQSLAARWAVQPGFLQREVMAWLPTTQHARLAHQWPAIVQQSLVPLKEQPVQPVAKQQRHSKTAGNQEMHAGSGKPGLHSQGKGASVKKRAAVALQAGHGLTDVSGARAATQLAPEKSKKRRTKSKG